MAKQKESPEATTATTQEKPVVEEKTKEKAVAASEQKEKPQPKKDPKPPGPVVPFVRWFNAKGFKPHWRGGMEAFADTTGRKTMDEWDKIFKNY